MVKLEIFLSMLCLIIISLSPLYALEESDSQTRDETKQKQHDLSFALSINSIVHKIKQKKNLLIIDVRNPEDYLAVRIPGSINLPLYSIKTKNYLKSDSFILVNNGANYSELEKEALVLRASGFDARILWGGLNAWKQKGLELEGDVFEAGKTNLVSPRDFHLEKDYEGNVCILISSDKNKNYQENYPSFNHVEKLEDDFIALFAGSKDTQNSRLFFISNEDGHGYDQYEEFLKRSEIANVFFLSGGLNAYQIFLDQLSLSQMPRESRLEAAGRCIPCGK